MASDPTQIGPYTIDREIGRGGMGVVYLGRDTRLDRAVAIKALPEHLAADPGRMARFEREAKLLASLTHANIAGVYGLENHEGAHYLVMEFVDGDDLAARLRNGPLPVDEALSVAAQIAAGVEAAHEAGVIHRDLKPANVIVTPDDVAKVLDFGLAKELESSGSSLDLTASPTLSLAAPVTQEGQVMGTAGYLSPEQARGKKLDKRTDIWAFACILYECLTGQVLFGGETASDSIAAILERELDFSKLPPRTPPRVRELLVRCLEKDPHKRLRDIGDARLELEIAINQREWTTGSFQAVAGGSPKRGSRRGAMLGALGVLLGAAAVWAGGKLNATPSGDVASTALRFDAPIMVDGEPMAIAKLAIAPDGSAMAAVPEGDGPIVVREFDSFEVRSLAGTEGAESLAFSPNGHWIAFIQQNQLFRISRDGGLPLPIAGARELDTDEGYCWVDPETIVGRSADARSLRRISVSAGTNSQLASVLEHPGLLGFETLCPVPGQDYLLASVYTGNSVDAYSIARVSLATGTMEVVLPQATHPMVTSSGSLVFLRDSSLFAVPFDFARGVVTGSESRVLDGVKASKWGGTPTAALSWSGMLVYLPGQRTSNGRRLVHVSESGEIEAITEPDALGSSLAVKRDGSLIAVNTLRRALESWIYDAGRGSMRRIVSEGEAYRFAWDSSGSRLAYDQILPSRGYALNDIVVRDIGSGGRPRVIATLPDVNVMGWLPDDSDLLITQELHPDTDAPPWTALRVLRLDEGDTTTPFFEQEGYSISAASFSPDGEWVAYLSDESGQSEVYLRRYPELDRARQVSYGTTFGIIWSPDSSALYFGQRDHMMKTTIEDVDGNVSIGAATELFALPWPQAWSSENPWAMGPDGRFIAIEPAEWEQVSTAPRVILNWGQDLLQSP
ncbi:MAG: putative Ser/Thr protein kinase/WD40 repeat protein [Phycisphaerales bacterium]|jgi:predicted Ser/Thr protein kinase/WD40 repeat protein